MTFSIWVNSIKKVPYAPGDAYTRFTFPGRRHTHSEFIWDRRYFTGVDYAHDLQENSIFTIPNEYGSGWKEVIDTEKGNNISMYGIMSLFDAYKYFRQ